MRKRSKPKKIEKKLALFQPPPSLSLSHHLFSLTQTNQTKNIGARRHPGGHDGEDHEGAGARRGDAEAAGDEGHHGKGVFQLFHLPLRSFFQRRKKAPPFSRCFFSPVFPLFFFSLFALACSSPSVRRGGKERRDQGLRSSPRRKNKHKKLTFPPPRPRNDKQKKTLNKKLKKKPKNEQEMQSDPMAFMKYTSDADVMLVLNKLQEMFGPAAAQMQAQQAAAGGGGPPPGSS